MGRVRVVRNDLPKVIRKLDENVDKAVDDQARALSKDLSAIVWYRYGYIEDATVPRVRGVNHAEVWVGFNKSTGFYSRFQEWGTIHQAPRPIVGPETFRHENIYARRMTRAVKSACALAGAEVQVA